MAEFMITDPTPSQPKQPKKAKKTKKGDVGGAAASVNTADETPVKHKRRSSKGSRSKKSADAHEGAIQGVNNDGNSVTAPLSPTVRIVRVGRRTVFEEEKCDAENHKELRPLCESQGAGDEENEEADGEKNGGNHESSKRGDVETAGEAVMAIDKTPLSATTTFPSGVSAPSPLTLCGHSRMSTMLLNFQRCPVCHICEFSTLKNTLTSATANVRLP